MPDVIESIIDNSLGLLGISDTTPTTSLATTTSAGPTEVKTAQPDDGSGHESDDSDDSSTTTAGSQKTQTKASASVSVSASASAAVAAITAQNAAIASDTNVSPTPAASTTIRSALLPMSLQTPSANTNTIQAIASAPSTSTESTSTNTSTSTPTSVTTVPETTATSTTSSTSSSIQSTTLTTSVSSSISSSSSSVSSVSRSSTVVSVPTSAASSATPVPSKADDGNHIPVAGIVVASAMGFLALLTVLFLIFRYCTPVRRRYGIWQFRRKTVRTYRSALDDPGVPLEKTISRDSNSMNSPPQPIVYTDQRFYASESTKPTTRTSEARRTGLGLGNRLSLLMQHSPFQTGHSNSEVRQSQIGMAVSDPRYDRSLPALPR